MDQLEWKGEWDSTLALDVESTPASSLSGYDENRNESRSLEPSLEPSMDLDIASIAPSDTPTPASNWIGWDGAQDPENP